MDRRHLLIAFCGTWYGLWWGFAMGVLFAEPLRSKLGEWFVRGWPGVLMPLMMFVAMLPGMIVQIVKGIARFRAAAKRRADAPVVPES